MIYIQQGPSQFSSDYKQGSDSFWPMNLHNMNFQSFVITTGIVALHMRRLAVDYVSTCGRGFAMRFSVYCVLFVCNNYLFYEIL